MTYDYFVTSHAEKDLEDILDYIALELNNPTAAQALGRKIFDAIDNIRAFPKSGTLTDNVGIADKAVRRLVIDNYLLYYKLLDDDKLIYILRIVYGQRNQTSIR